MCIDYDIEKAGCIIIDRYRHVISTYLALPVGVPLPFKLIFLCVYRRQNSAKGLDLWIQIQEIL
jgi:hypothetical protein